jgi:hypothetical protein
MGCAYPSTPGLTLRGRSGDRPYKGLRVFFDAGADAGRAQKIAPLLLPRSFAIILLFTCAPWALTFYLREALGV